LPLEQAVWNGCGSGTAQAPLPHAVWNGCGSGTAHAPELQAVWSGAGSDMHAAPPVVIAGAKAAKITTCFMSPLR
jgi:hypothetical protein